MSAFFYRRSDRSFLCRFLCCFLCCFLSCSSSVKTFVFFSGFFGHFTDFVTGFIAIKPFSATSENIADHVAFVRAMLEPTYPLLSMTFNTFWQCRQRVSGQGVKSNYRSIAPGHHTGLSLSLHFQHIPEALPKARSFPEQPPYSDQ